VGYGPANLVKLTPAATATLAITSGARLNKRQKLFPLSISGVDMIVWRGWGLGALGIAAVVNILMQWLIGMAMGDDNYGKTHGWTWLVSMGVVAVCVWVVGVKLESKPGKVVIDKETGQELELKSRHDMFWIPFKYWAIAFFGLGIAFAYSK